MMAESRPHLHPSSNQNSPLSTPPASSVSLPSRASPPPTSTPTGHAGASAPLPVAAAAPSSPSSNRFGLALNFIGRRPRGSTNPSNMSLPSGSPVASASLHGGGRSPGNGSPSSELPPSPSGGGERTGAYGFPALRRTLSRRTGTGSSGGTPEPQPTPRANVRRSASQPPGPLNDRDSSSSSRPTTPADTPAAPPFAPLAPSASAPAPPTSRTATAEEKHRIRLVPHLESSRSLHFDPVDRDLGPFTVLRVGRFTDRSQPGTTDPLRIAFKSKVVSRGHAEIWADDHGKFFIKDTKSSSGTFLNHIRLSGPGAESRPFPLKDGDVLQLGVDYQGGTEEIYRCVKMRIELNRGWQRGMNSFNTNALAQLRALGGGAGVPMEAPGTAPSAIAPSMSPMPAQKVQPAAAAAAAAAAASSMTDCCICLYPVTVCQALFIAPCSHVTHFKCIRPLVQQNYPGFCCPLCRTYADLEADVEIEPWEAEAPPAAAPQPETVEEEPEPEDDPMGDAPTRSRRSSLLVSGPSGEPVPLGITEHRGPSRPSSLAPAEEHPSLPLPMAIGPASSSLQDEICSSLADAATPPNSTFLSTLADSGAFPRYHAPVSLGMALDSVAGPSGGEREERRSFGSEEGTDGDAPAAATGTAAGKGKGVERAPPMDVDDVVA